MSQIDPLVPFQHFREIVKPQTINLDGVSFLFYTSELDGLNLLPNAQNCLNRRICGNCDNR
jgi:hypothetical protein